LPVKYPIANETIFNKKRNIKAKPIRVGKRKFSMM